MRERQGGAELTIGKRLQGCEGCEGDPADDGCKLGRALGDCALRRAGCGSLYDVAMYLLPPWSVREYVRLTMADDPAALAWLARLERIGVSKQPYNRHLSDAKG